EHGPKLVLLVVDVAGYQTLCRLITQARRRAAKGEYRLLREDLDTPRGGLLALWGPDTDADTDEANVTWLQRCFDQRLWIAVELHRGADDGARLSGLQDLGQRHGLPLVAAGDVHMHARGRRALQDAMTAIRHHTTLA